MLIAVGVLGAVLGSFAGAQVWRLRARQLIEDKEAGEKIDNKELKKLSPLIKKRMSQDRSCCLACGHVLAWYDLIPIISWVLLLGRCRYCKNAIGWTEIIIESGLAALFVLSAIFWPEPLTDVWQIILITLWFMGLVLLVIMFVYDVRWLLLPDVVNIPFSIIGAMFAVIRLIMTNDPVAALFSLVGAIGILSGLYAMLYMVSKLKYGEQGTWVGFGDVKLGLGLALFLGDWLLALAALFMANLIGTILALPSMLTGRLHGNSRIA